MQGIAHPAIVAPELVYLSTYCLEHKEMCCGRPFLRPFTETQANGKISALITSVHTPHVRPVAVYAGLKLGQQRL
jgi:hypothetical protein